MWEIAPVQERGLWQKWEIKKKTTEHPLGHSLQLAPPASACTVLNSQIHILCLPVSLFLGEPWKSQILAFWVPGLGHHPLSTGKLPSTWRSCPFDSDGSILGPLQFPKINNDHYPPGIPHDTRLNFCTCHLLIFKQQWENSVTLQKCELVLTGSYSKTEVPGDQPSLGPRVNLLHLPMSLSTSIENKMIWYHCCSPYIFIFTGSRCLPSRYQGMKPDFQTHCAPWERSPLLISMEHQCMYIDYSDIHKSQSWEGKYFFPPI